jgi:hypothetical protein
VKTKAGANKVEVFLKDIGALIENTAKKNSLLADKFIDDLKSDCDKLDKIRNDYGLEKNTGFNIIYIPLLFYNIIYLTFRTPSSYYI